MNTTNIDMIRGLAKNSETVLEHLYKRGSENISVYKSVLKRVKSLANFKQTFVHPCVNLPQKITI